MDDKILFMLLCIGDPPPGASAKPHWIVTGSCRGCGQPVTRDDFAVWHTYWKAMWAPCHKGCRDDGMRREAIECQTIDADCNDCVHFRRGTELGRGPAAAFDGHCMKFDKPTLAYPNFARGMPCFEHRRVMAKFQKANQA